MTRTDSLTTFVLVHTALGLSLTVQLIALIVIRLGGLLRPSAILGHA